MKTYLGMVLATLVTGISGFLIFEGRSDLTKVIVKKNDTSPLKHIVFDHLELVLSRP